MAAVKHVQAKILSQCKRPVRTFAGDERVHALVGGCFHFRARAAGDDADFAATRRAARQHGRLGVGRFGQALGQLRPRQVKRAAQADRLAALGKKRLGLLDAKCPAKLGVVAEPWMRVQRQVRAVNGDVVVKQQPQQSVAVAGPRMRRSPKQPVVDDQQIRPGVDRLLDRGRRGVHRSGEARHAAAILHLQPVHRTGPVLKRLRFEGAVAVRDDVGELDLGHAGEGTNLAAPSQAGNAVGAAGVLTFGGCETLLAADF